eukprot:1138550-Prymnesium_polylepis.2
MLSAPVAWAAVLSSLAILLACVFGTFGLYQHYPTNWSLASYREQRRVHRTQPSRLVHRSLWPLLLLLRRQRAHLEHAPQLQVYGKLTYSAYIFHPIVMLAYNFSKYDYVQYSDQWLGAFWTVFVVWASIVALIVWLVIEKPCANMLAWALARLGVGGSGGV